MKSVFLCQTCICCGSNESTTTLDGATYITILLALLAGMIALWQVKSNVISSARIKWIEDLTSSLSQFYSAVMTAIVTRQNYLAEKKRRTDKEQATQQSIDANEEECKLYDNYLKNYYDFTMHANIIRMHLNLERDDHREIERLISGIEKTIDSDKIDSVDVDQIEAKLKEIVSKASNLFRTQWVKSKRIFNV